jgi:hypothetical protein
MIQIQGDGYSSVSLALNGVDLQGRGSPCRTPVHAMSRDNRQ